MRRDKGLQPVPAAEAQYHIFLRTSGGERTPIKPANATDAADCFRRLAATSAGCSPVDSLTRDLLVNRVVLDVPERSPESLGVYASEYHCCTPFFSIGVARPGDYCE